MKSNSPPSDEILLVSSSLNCVGPSHSEPRLKRESYIHAQHYGDPNHISPWNSSKKSHFFSSGYIKTETNWTPSRCHRRPQWHSQWRDTTPHPQRPSSWSLQNPTLLVLVLNQTIFILWLIHSYLNLSPPNLTQSHLQGVPLRFLVP